MASRYIRQGAPGNGSGSDWLNAYTSVPAAMTRGDTYYLGDGSYGSVVLDDAESGTAYCIIRRATIADHGTSTGWLDAYAAGQASFTRISFATPYWAVDGGGKTGWTTGHGILILSSTDATELVRIEGGVSYLSLLNLEMHGDLAEVAQVVGIYATQEGGCSHITVKDCNIHHTFGVHAYFINGSYLTFQRNNFERNKSTGGTYGVGLEGIHSESLQLRACSYLDISNNRFKDIQGTGAIVSGGVAIPHWAGADTNSHDWDIHHNVFDGGYVRVSPVGGETSGAPGAVLLDNTNTGGEAQSLTVNAFYNIKFRENIIISNGYASGGVHAFNSGGNVEVYGNVWYGGTEEAYVGFPVVSGPGVTRREYNHYSKMKGPFGLRYYNGGTEMGPHETHFTDGVDKIVSDVTESPFTDSNYTLSPSVLAAVAPYVPGINDLGGGGEEDPEPPESPTGRRVLFLAGRMLRIGTKVVTIG